MKRRCSESAAKKTVADELQPEYDLKTLLKGGVQGKYAKRYHDMKKPSKSAKHAATAKTR